MREMGSETWKRSVLGSQCHEAGLFWNLQVLPTKETWNSESAGSAWHPGPVLLLLRSWKIQAEGGAHVNTCNDEQHCRNVGQDEHPQGYKWP